MEAGKAEIIGAVLCVISGDKLHINLAVETKAYSTVQTSVTFMPSCWLFSLFLHIWLPSNTVMAVRDAGKNMKENTTGAWMHTTEDLSLVPMLWREDNFHHYSS